MNFKEIKSQFTLSHISLVAFTFVVIGGILTMQNWNTVKGMFNRNDVAKQEQESLYYAYEAPAVPTVLGADTLPDGPGVINEDGTVSTLNSLGEVLGASSDSPEINLDSIQVKTFPGSPENFRPYLDETFIIESKILPGDFESALVSKDPAQTQNQINILIQVQSSLSNMSVPKIVEKLHKLKIAQYGTAIDLLKNFSLADSNPELVSSKLTLFMEMQKAQDAETQALFKTYPKF